MTNRSALNEKTKMVVDMLKTPPPRNIPPELLRIARTSRNVQRELVRIARILFESIMMWGCFISGIYLIVFLISFLLNITAIFDSKMLPFAFLCLIQTFFYAYNGYRNRKIALKILESGIACKARVSKIKRVSSFKANDEEHSELFLEVQSPDGSIVHAVDVIDNRFVELFFTLRDEGKELDVLFNRDYPTKAIAIDRLLMNTRDWDH